MEQSSNIRAGGLVLFTLVSGVIILLAVVSLYIKLIDSGSSGGVAVTIESITQTRIQPVGQATMGDDIVVDEHKGDQIFSEIYIQCHTAGSIVPSVSRPDNKGDWASHIVQDFDAPFQHILNGFNTIPAEDDAVGLADQGLKRVITYMANKDGTNFPDPDTAAFADATTSGAAPTAASAATDGITSAASVATNAVKTEDGGAATPASSDADGKKVYEASCQACHGGAAPGAPHVGKKKDWAPRIKQGKDTLYKHAFEGSNTMPTKGSDSGLSDDEVKVAVDYMANQSGAKF